jgi:dihydroflavonol-4-reductase
MIVVTSGTGLLGAHLLLELVNTDDRVRVIMRKGSSRKKVFSVWKHYHDDPRTLLGRFEWYEADLTNKAEVCSAIEGASKIYHCAGFVSFSSGQKRAFRESNIEIIANLVDACLQISGIKLVHVSSVAAIGKTVGEKQSSESGGWPVSAKSMYARTKIRGELEVWRGIAEGLNAIIVNPSVILGPGDWEKSSARIFEVVYKGLGFYTKGVTGFVDVRDVVNVILELMHSDITGERFIVSAANLTFEELFAKIAFSFDKKPPSHYASPLMTSFAWRTEWLYALLTGRQPRITRVSARSAHAIQEYTAEKVCSRLDFSFRNIDETIREVAACYLKDKMLNK